MQLHYTYLVKNRINIVSNEAGFITEYKPVYHRQINLYRGIDNTVEFRLLNADQKPITVTTTPYIVIHDESNRQIIKKSATVLDDGSTTSTKGLFKFVIADNDTLNVNDQFLSYTIYLEDTNSNTLTYVNTAFDACGSMKLSSCAFPGALASVEVKTFLQDNETWVSEAVSAEPGINGNDALHTAAIYTDSYSGDVKVQGTLENQIIGGTYWSDIDTVTFSGSETQPTAINFNGVYSFIRFVATADPANKITKILVRN